VSATFNASRVLYKSPHKGTMTENRCLNLGMLEGKRYNLTVMTVEMSDNRTRRYNTLIQKSSVDNYPTDCHG
jgi:hypothetical protein